MKKIIYTLFLGLAFGANSQTQCNSNVTPTSATVCPGDSVLINIQASITSSGQSFSFNGATLPAGWSTSGGSTFTSPCGPSPDNTPYYWASTAGSGTPSVTTAAFDVGCGGDLEFQMVYSVQSGASPCEGPDQYNEGVEIQYSTDNGVTWNSIIYYPPIGGTLTSTPTATTPGTSGATPYTTWSTFNVPIPTAAWTANTMFRWIQINSSGSAFDNWGLDNVSINAGPCNSADVDWDGDSIPDGTSFYYTPSVDTFFVAAIYDTNGFLQCYSDTVWINVFTPNISYSLPNQVVSDCRTDSAQVTIQNPVTAVPPLTYQWSNGATTPSTWLQGSGLTQDTLPYYVTITDACGFTYDDTVIHVVNQTLAVDTVLSGPASCDPDGYVSGIISGATNVNPTNGQPFQTLYNWTGPGAGNPNNFNASVWTNLSSGWYYFTAQDAVCQVNDSVFVDVINVPNAQSVASPNYGCGPLNVTFSNTSENATSYTWVFSNGNTINETTTNSQTQLFNQTGMSYLVASNGNPNCNDTVYINVTVVECGCTDPTALNYNPNALADDGSCVYPIPPAPTISVPNVITPNGNNPLYYFTTTNAASIEMTILNRWGNVIYTATGTQDLPPIWDGKDNTGKEVQEGTYFYRYRLVGINEEVLEGHGFLQVDR